MFWIHVVEDTVCRVSILLVCLNSYSYSYITGMFNDTCHRNIQEFCVHSLRESKSEQVIKLFIGCAQGWSFSRVSSQGFCGQPWPW